MDLFGLVIFILFVVLKALGESSKKSGRRETRPVFTDRRPPVFPPEEEEMPVPEVNMDWEIPPAFPFPWEEPPRKEVKGEKSFGTDREFIPAEKLVSAEIKAGERQMPPRLPEVRVSPEASVLSTKQVLQGIIWAEIIQAPRAIRPYRPMPWRQKIL